MILRKKMKNKRRGLCAKDHQSFVPQSSSTLALAFAPRDFLGERGDLGELPWLPQSPKPPEVLILATGADVGGRRDLQLDKAQQRQSCNAPTWVYTPVIEVT